MSRYPHWGPTNRQPRRRKRLLEPNCQFSVIISNILRNIHFQIELREDYDDPVFGTCIESAIGGNHFRMWRQNGPSANSGALFLAASKEQSAAQGHNIVQNGYNKGRDLLAANARGTIKYNGVTYTTTIDRLTGLLTPGSQGVNHGKQRLKQVFDLNFS
ncbi:hypothetical protein AX15_004629 [Amanita polypyramis BW_CC]|nr:hypothetical protein AX15_004629 [Amanita polypyramis BW_CC]